jgi:hypothetical protein
MDLAMPTTVWLRRSTTPFCCGEYGAVKCRSTPVLEKWAASSFDVNSPPRSVQSVCSVHRASVYASAWKRFRASPASSFVVNRTSHMKRL